MRRLRPDPVPEEALLALVDAALHAPSGSNAQNWRFVIVRDRRGHVLLPRLEREEVGLPLLFSRRDLVQHLLNLMLLRLRLPLAFPLDGLLQRALHPFEAPV